MNYFSLWKNRRIFNSLKGGAIGGAVGIVIVIALHFVINTSKLSLILGIVNPFILLVGFYTWEYFKAKKNDKPVMSGKIVEKING